MVRRNFGFTLIELMVTLAVIVVLSMLALPSFRTFQQRSATRGAAEHVLSLWNQARFEAAKRGSYVKFSVKSNSGNYCIGLATTTTTTDATPCDCLTAHSCNIAEFPASQSEWNSVTLSGTPTLGVNTGVAVIDPRLTTLTESGDAGAISLASPSGPRSYKLNISFDRQGRGYVCESQTAQDHMADFSDRQCSP